MPDAVHGDEEPRTMEFAGDGKEPANRADNRALTWVDPFLLLHSHSDAGVDKEEAE
jgi:hypothetical protein